MLKAVRARKGLGRELAARGVEPPTKEEDEEKKHDKPVDEAGVLHGVAVSPGKVRGPARVMETVASALPYLDFVGMLSHRNM